MMTRPAERAGAAPAVVPLLPRPAAQHRALLRQPTVVSVAAVAVADRRRRAPHAEPRRLLSVAGASEGAACGALSATATATAAAVAAAGGCRSSALCCAAGCGSRRIAAGAAPALSAGRVATMLAVCHYDCFGPSVPYFESGKCCLGEREARGRQQAASLSPATTLPCQRAALPYGRTTVRVVPPASILHASVCSLGHRCPPVWGRGGA